MITDAASLAKEQDDSVETAETEHVTTFVAITVTMFSIVALILLSLDAMALLEHVKMLKCNLQY